MPGGKFSLEKSANNQALAAAVTGSGMGYPAPDAAPGANDILALLKNGKMDPQAIMALLALLAGMGTQGPVGAAPPMPGEATGVDPMAAMGGGGGVPSPIAQAYGG